MFWCCWLGGRKGIRRWWGAGMVICLERDADLHMAQLMPLPLTVSSFSKIRICFTFLVPAHPGSPRKRAIKGWCVIVSKHLSTYVFLCTWCLFSEFCCFCCCPFSYLSLYLLTLHSSAMSILTAPRVYIEALHVLWWGVLCICVMEGALHVCVDETVNSVLSYFKRSAWLEH